MTKMEELAARRNDLQARCEMQRARLSQYHARLSRPIEIAGVTFSTLNSLRRSPLVVAGTAALLLKTPWRKLARVPRLAWRGWKIFQFVRSWTHSTPKPSKR